MGRLMLQFCPVERYEDSWVKISEFIMPFWCSELPGSDSLLMIAVTTLSDYSRVA